MKEVPKLSPTTADRQLRKGSRACWYRHRLLGGKPKPMTTSQREGRMWHSALLEGAHDVEAVDCDDFRSAKAKEARDEIESDPEKIAVPKAKLEALKPACIRISEELAEFGITLDGQREVLLEWDEFTADQVGVVKCKGYADLLQPGQILEFKSQKSEPMIPDAVRQLESGYSLLQDPAYREGVWQMFDDSIEPDLMKFIYVFFQTEEPFQVLPVTLAGDFRELAMLRWRRAIEQWYGCISKGTDRKHWPPLVQGVTPITAPGWAMNRELEIEAMS